MRTLWRWERSDRAPRPAGHARAARAMKGPAVARHCCCSASSNTSRPFEQESLPQSSPKAGLHPQYAFLGLQLLVDFAGERVVAVLVDPVEDRDAIVLREPERGHLLARVRLGDVEREALARG